ncbi:MAG: glycosyltransferase family 39 protein [Acetobacteraceae bacterium]|nr:glycosyltransferase family 39 protein [Acetobacteraceae bacterium]
MSLLPRLLQSKYAVPPLMLAAAFLLRGLSFVPYVIDTDEGLYMLQAQAWLHGQGWPLIAVWDMHPVGAPILIAGAMALFGETLGAVRLLGMLAVTASATGLYAIARQLRLPHVVGLGAGVLYLGMTNRFNGLATNTEILFAPFIVAALAVALAAAIAAIETARRPGFGTLAVVGLLVGIALTIKPVAMPEGCFAFLVLVLPAWRRGVIALGRVAVMAAAYALLCLAPTLLLAACYALIGSFDVFFDTVILAPFRYAGGRLPAADAAWLIAASALFLLWPFLAALVALGRARAFPRAVLFSATWLLFATAAIMLPGFYYNHYFIIWMPPLSLLASCGLWYLAGRLWPARAALALAVMLGIVATDSWADRTAVRMHSGTAMRFPDPVAAVAAALAANIEPGAVVLVANYHPLVYMLAGASVPSRYVFPAQLTGEFGDVGGIDMDSEVARILAARPAAIVVDRGWWLSIRPSVRTMLTRALEQHYELRAEVEEDRGPVEIWHLR